MIRLKRKSPETYRVDETHSFTFTLRRLLFDEAPDVVQALSEMWAAYGSPNEENAQERTAAAVRMMRAAPAGLVKRVFESYVSDVQGLEDEDGNAITTGAQLYEFADLQLSIFVMIRLQRLARVSVPEGNASASPSTSPAEKEPQTTSPDSGASSTEGEALTAPSTATEIQTPVESSIGQE